MKQASRPGPFQRWMEQVNGPWHAWSMQLFIVIVSAHWVEHLLQAFQVYGLHWHRSHALGGLGLLAPWLVTSEWLHYAYALVMLVGFLALRPAFVGRGRLLWDIALAMQVWHHLEHALLIVQAMTGVPWFGASSPVSLLQLLIPRVELHLFYNAVVTVPMLLAAYFHVRPPAGAQHMATCCCTHRLRRVASCGSFGVGGA